MPKKSNSQKLAKALTAKLKAKGTPLGYNEVYDLVKSVFEVDRPSALQGTGRWPTRGGYSGGGSAESMAPPSQVPSASVANSGKGGELVRVRCGSHFKMVELLVAQSLVDSGAGKWSAGEVYLFAGLVSELGFEECINDFASFLNPNRRPVRRQSDGYPLFYKVRLDLLNMYDRAIWPVLKTSMFRWLVTEGVSEAYIDGVFEGVKGVYLVEHGEGFFPAAVRWEARSGHQVAEVKPYTEARMVADGVAQWSGASDDVYLKVDEEVCEVAGGLAKLIKLYDANKFEDARQKALECGRLLNKGNVLKVIRG